VESVRDHFDVMTTAAPLLDGAAFITGAGSGIGQSTAFAFARYGVKKFGLTDIKPENLQSTVQKLQELNKDIEIEAIEMDVANEQAVASAIEKAVNKFGRIDYAVNNAGIEGPLVPTGDMDLKGWNRCLDVNITVSILLEPDRAKKELKFANTSVGAISLSTGGNKADVEAIVNQPDEAVKATVLILI
jgi:NAD(P)-dependent dehydrogenase (short-subunit alcohol dehydrogenase family)